MRHKGRKSHDFVTRQGNISLQGIYYHCGCSNSKSVNILVSAGRKYSRAADELIVRYAGSHSYQQARGYLRKDFHINLSSETLRMRISEISGQIRQHRNSGQNIDKWENMANEKLYGYADGVLINVRQEGWKECKLLRYENEFGTQLSHRALLGSIKDFGLLARREAIHIGASDAEEVVFLMDGAEGFHHHIKRNLPSARQVVDYWHVCQHIGECATEIYGRDNADGHRWRRKYCHVLREDGPRKLLASLRISRSHAKTDASAKALMELINFLARRIDRIDYPTLLEQGYRVDSGPIESSCKKVVQARMKGPGMRWSRKGASAMLEIRCALYSNIWENLINNCA